MKKTYLLLFITLIFISCKKDNNVIITENQEINMTKEAITEEKVVEKKIDVKTFDQSVFKHQFQQIILFSNNVILKEKSTTETNSESKIFLDDIYEIKYIDTENNITKTILSDKFRNTWLLPILDYEIIIKHEKDEIIKRSTDFRCFVLHRTAGSTYKLLYINELNKENQILDEVEIIEYEYKTVWIPGDGLKIIITPNYFIVRHWDISGEEYLLINRETGEYRTIDSREDSKH